MAHFEKCEFTKVTVVLDGNEYVSCKFEDCRVVVTRGNFLLQDSSFTRCRFDFAGEAENIKRLVMGLVNQSKDSPQPALG
ncbi:MAG: hypothetical protein L6Q31_11765 [Fimbriimonadaceae bacterium]|nr:hypothetical protein [Fimbriimonadaceae bacterium]